MARLLWASSTRDGMSVKPSVACLTAMLLSSIPSAYALLLRVVELSNASHAAPAGMQLADLVSCLGMAAAAAVGFCSSQCICSTASCANRQQLWQERVLLQQLSGSGAVVLITQHPYVPFQMTK